MDVSRHCLSRHQQINNEQSNNLSLARAQEKRHSGGAIKASVKLKANCFYSLNNKLEALLEFRSGLRYWIIKTSLINTFCKWSDLAKMKGVFETIYVIRAFH